MAPTLGHNSTGKYPTLPLHTLWGGGGELGIILIGAYSLRKNIGAYCTEPHQEYMRREYLTAKKYFCIASWLHLIKLY